MSAAAKTVGSMYCCTSAAIVAASSGEQNEATRTIFVARTTTGSTATMGPSRSSVSELTKSRSAPSIASGSGSWPRPLLRRCKTLDHLRRCHAAGETRLSTPAGAHYAQVPPSRTVHIISNVEVEDGATASEVTLRCNVIVYVLRPGNHQELQVGLGRPRAVVGCCGKNVGPRVWDYCRARLGWNMVAFNIWAQ